MKMVLGLIAAAGAFEVLAGAYRLFLWAIPPGQPADLVVATWLITAGSALFALAGGMASLLGEIRHLRAAIAPASDQG